MSEKRARKQARRAKRRDPQAPIRKLRDRDQLEQRRAAAHGISAWSGPERQRKAAKLVRRAQEAIRALGVPTKGDLVRDARDFQVAPPDAEREMIDDALARRRKEDADDDG